MKRPRFSEEQIAYAPRQAERPRSGTSGGQRGDVGGLSGAGPAVGRPARGRPLPSVIRPSLGVGLCPEDRSLTAPRSPAQARR